MSLSLVLFLFHGWPGADPVLPPLKAPFAIYGEAQPEPDEQPAQPIPAYPSNYRYLYIQNLAVKHHWVLVNIPDSAENCQIYLPFNGAPRDEDILGFCGLSAYQEWVDRQSCTTDEEGCSAIGLVYISPVDLALETSVTLPGPVAYVDTANCSPWSLCDQRPRLVFGGAEPIESYRISTVYVIFEGGEVAECLEFPCLVDMPVTDEYGIKVTYYAVSSYGDRSWSRDFEMRNLPMGQGRYLFQLMGDPWWYDIPVGPAQWEVFPATATMQIPWLMEASQPADLATEYDLSLLAGKLILRGTVSAASCPDGGLLTNGAASACGTEAARPQVIEAQNRFDQQIWEAALASHVPPHLLKGLVAQESQFWNGWVIKGEKGYGMLTENGMDMLLTWNLPFFLDLCVPVYGTLACASGYSALADYPRAYLRGLALQKVGTDEEFLLLAETLAAAAGQAGQLVRNITSQPAGQIMAYDQLWMVSLAIYNGGAGCVGTAITGAFINNRELTWPNISEYLLGNCQEVADYPYRVLAFSQ
jgi:hypothetical protein